MFNVFILWSIILFILGLLIFILGISFLLFNYSKYISMKKNCR